MTIEYRLLGLEDISILDAVADDVFDHPLIPEQVARFLADRSHFIAVAIDDGSVVGIGTANEYLHPDKPVQFWVQEMGVAPSHQRRGIGSRLLEMLLDVARERGHAEAWLGTENDNTPARALYRSLGGQEEPFVMYTFNLGSED
jgi:aminoglycoside 6'-N-acetyltransferase I